jgi:hypothetical protein
MSKRNKKILEILDELAEVKRVKVKATINGEPYRGSLVRMGGECQIGKSFGDEVEIAVEEDTEPREVQAPRDMLEALGLSPVALVFRIKAGCICVTRC